MKYGIIVNPAAGKLSVDEKLRVLKPVTRVFGYHDCEIAGLDTKSKVEFQKCAADLAARVNILVVGGGDGTLHDVINSVPSEHIKAYLPLGSGTFSGYSLGYPLTFSWFLPMIAKKIRDGKEHSLDLILCEGFEKAINASVGIDGRVLMESETYVQKGMDRFTAYAKAIEKLLREGPEQFDAALKIDGSEFKIKKAMSVIVTKVPFYGYGLKPVPQADFEDGKLHLLTINKPEFVFGLFMSFFGGNRFGDYRTGQSVLIDARKEVYLQMDGGVGRKGSSFRFDVLPGELKMRY